MEGQSRWIEIINKVHELEAKIEAEAKKEKQANIIKRQYQQQLQHLLSRITLLDDVKENEHTDNS